MACSPIETTTCLLQWGCPIELLQSLRTHSRSRPSTNSWNVYRRLIGLDPVGDDVLGDQPPIEGLPAGSVRSRSSLL